jgi:hypothetical protein
MRMQSRWQIFFQLQARQSFYGLASALMRVVIANFNNITAHCSSHVRGIDATVTIV